MTIEIDSVENVLYNGNVGPKTSLLIQFSSKESTLYTKKRVMYVSSFNRFLSIPLTDHKL